MKAKDVLGLIQEDIKDGLITVVSCEEFDVRFKLNEPLLIFSEGVIYQNDLGTTEIGFLAQKHGSLPAERFNYSFDGVSILSSIMNSLEFARLVKSINNASHFCKSNANTINYLDRCQCEGTERKSKRILGFDLSFPSIPRRRGILSTSQCVECQQWSLAGFHADTQNIVGRDNLIAYMDNFFDGTDIEVPEIESLVETPTAQYKLFTAYSSKRQQDERRRAILRLKDKSAPSLEDLKEAYKSSR